MKKKNIVLSLVGVIALVTGLSVSNVQGAEMCDNHRIIAENTMSLRLKGIPEENVDAMMESEIGKSIVGMAYSRSLPSDVKLSDEANEISDFGDYVNESCEGVVRRQKYGNNWQKVDGVAI